uniref:AtALMT9 (Aluminum-activated malate transporter 9) n=1 Tax=Arundo donax TaxID=35708 RepID=A0A0A9ETJ9_ARUDO
MHKSNEKSNAINASSRCLITPPLSSLFPFPQANHPHPNQAIRVARERGHRRFLSFFRFLFPSTIRSRSDPAPLALASTLYPPPL